MMAVESTPNIERHVWVCARKRDHPTLQSNKKYTHIYAHPASILHSPMNNSPKDAQSPTDVMYQVVIWNVRIRVDNMFPRYW